MSAVVIIFVVFLSVRAETGSESDRISIRPQRRMLTVEPGGLATVPLEVIGKGDSTGCYRLSTSAPAGFSAVHVPDRVCLGDERAVTSLLSYFVVSSTPAGSYQLEVSVIHESMGTLESTHVSISVERSGGVSVDAPTRGQGWPGGKVSYEVRITNRGNYPDIYSVSAKSRGDVSPPSREVDIDPGVSEIVVLELTVPEESEPGGVCYLTLNVLSRGDERIKKTIRIETHLLPPPPEEVGGSLYPILPGTLKWSNNFRSGLTRSSLNFRWGGALSGETDIGVNGRLELDPGDLRLRGGKFTFRDAISTVEVGSISFMSPSGYVRGSGGRYNFREGILPFSISIVKGVNPHLYSSLELSSGDDFELHLYSEGMLDGLAAAFEFLSDNLRLSGKIGEEKLGLSLYRDPQTWEGTLNLSTKEFKLAYGGPDLSTETSLSFQSRARLETRIEYRGSSKNWQASLFGRFDATGPSWLPPSRLGAGGEIDFVSDRFSWGLEVRLENSSYSNLSSSSGGISLESYWGTDLGEDLKVRAEVRLAGLFSQSGGLYHRGKLELDFPLSADGWDAAVRVGAGSDGVSASTRLRGREGWIGFAADSGGVSLNLGKSFEAPFPLVTTKGRVVGAAFLDLDCDGRRGADEPGVDRLLLNLGPETALTDSDGNFRFYPLTPGEYALTVENISDRYVYSPPTITVREGGVTEVSLPLVLTAEVEGELSLFRPKKGTRSLEERGYDEVDWIYSGALEGGKVLLSDGESTYLQTVEGGRFRVTGLRPGRWQVKPVPESLPPQHYPLNEGVELTLGPGEKGELELRVARMFRMLPLEMAGDSV
ncbi:MAG: hypothetical protein ACOC88_02700 [Candidatus Bipolaricaulota bacterium]